MLPIRNANGAARYATDRSPGERISLPEPNGRLATGNCRVASHRIRPNPRRTDGNGESTHIIKGRRDYNPVSWRSLVTT
jgi:hypothetical protein